MEPGRGTGALLARLANPGYPIPLRVTRVIRSRRWGASAALFEARDGDGWAVSFKGTIACAMSRGGRAARPVGDDTYDTHDAVRGGVGDGREIGASGERNGRRLRRSLLFGK